MPDRRLRIVLCLALALIVAPAACDSSDDDDAQTEPPADTGDVLYAAAGSAVITPSYSNHPQTVYLGGVFPSRIGTGVHDDLLASALMLQQGDEHVVLVSLDLLGFTRTRGREIQERLAQYGFYKEQILIASTHTHEAPDTIGVFGPSVLQSGVSPVYMRFIQDTVVDLVLGLRERLAPVTMRAALVPIDVPESNQPTLINDFRLPGVTVPFLGAAVFEDGAGEAVATLVNWHTHPEVMIDQTLVSSDFPHWVRERMEAELGGTCVYISGANGGLSSPTDVDVPARGADGVFLREGSWEKAASLGEYIADRALDGLADARPAESPHLTVAVEELRLPMDNLVMILAFAVGLAEYDDAEIDRSDRRFCGWYGCGKDRIGLVRVGPVTIVTSPGETFPETFIGRAQTFVDFGDPWGVSEFKAIDGLIGSMDSPVPMHMSVCGDEIGYLIPEGDFHEKGHPDYYEESLYLGKDTETLYRAAAIDLLRRNP